LWIYLKVRHLGKVTSKKSAKEDCKNNGKVPNLRLSFIFSIGKKTDENYADLVKMLKKRRINGS